MARRCFSGSSNSRRRVSYEAFGLSVQRLGIAPFDPASGSAETISAEQAAVRLGICVGSVHRLIREGILPAAQLMFSAPWQIPVAALATDAVKIGAREIAERRPKFYKRFQEEKSLKLPGL
jgi:hypothetical protein